MRCTQTCANTRRLRGIPGTGPLTGAQRFLTSLGLVVEPFVASARGGVAADDRISASGPALVGAGAGGILHYRGYYPHDPLLRYWAGLVFAAAGRPRFGGRCSSRSLLPTALPQPTAD